MDDRRHQEYTGRPLDKVLDSLEYVCSYIRSHDKPSEIWIRTPIIPNTTSRPENIRQIGEYIHNNCIDLVTRWDLLAFNNLCKDKYQRLNLNWNFTDADLITSQEKDLLLRVAQETIPTPEIIHWGGSTKLEQDKVNNISINACTDQT
ncbi:MAG: hypothetical protein JEZ06_12570 [Anaerolineaceae bacterium]|nr:hypothetical protein [Anaerolineaceae bacterium]